MKVSRIDHTTIFVNDLDKAKALFTAILGTEFCEPTINEDFHYRTTMEPMGIEIIESTSPVGFIAQTIKRKGEGVGLVGLKVDDIENAIEAMKALNIRVISRIDQGQMKTAQFHPKDTFGITIELVEYQEKHPLITAMEGKV